LNQLAQDLQSPLEINHQITINSDLLETESSSHVASRGQSDGCGPPRGGGGGGGGGDDGSAAVWRKSGPWQ